MKLFEMRHSIFGVFNFNNLYYDNTRQAQHYASALRRSSSTRYLFGQVHGAPQQEAHRACFFEQALVAHLHLGDGLPTANVREQAEVQELERLGLQYGDIGTSWERKGQKLEVHAHRHAASDEMGAKAANGVKQISGRLWEGGKIKR